MAINLKKTEVRPQGSFIKPPSYTDEPAPVVSGPNGSDLGSYLDKMATPTAAPGTGMNLGTSQQGPTSTPAPSAPADSSLVSYLGGLPPTPSVVRPNIGAPVTGAGDSGVGGIGGTPSGSAGQVSMAPDPTKIPPGTVEGSSAYDDMLAKYMEQAFGQGRDFQPLEDKITGQRDDALRSMAEKLASRGMGASGLAAAGAQGIYSDTADQLSTAFQQWREQGVQDMRNAISPFQETEQAKDLMGFQTGELDTRDRNASDVLMDRVLGADRDPNTGTMAGEAFWGKWGQGTPDQAGSGAMDIKADHDLGIAPAPGQSNSGVAAKENKDLLDLGIPPYVLGLARDNPNSQSGEMIRKMLTKMGRPIPLWLAKK